MKIRYFIPIICLLIFSCQRDRIPKMEPVDLNLNLSYASEELNGKLELNTAKVTVTNLSTKVRSTYSPQDAAVSIENLKPGNYDIDASITISKEQYTQVTGLETAEDVTFNVSFKKYNLIRSTTLALELVAGTVGDFVIKQVYYAGSDQKNGALYRDQFFEIQNNTDRILYADSLYFGRIYGRQSITTDKEHYQPNGQLDWSKSENMTMGNEANTDYVYLRDLFMIPGDGHTYPIDPGKSIVIAQNALNHKVPFVGNNGVETPIRNPELTVDLSKATFETYFGDIPGKKPFASDINNLDVPNVEVLDYVANDWILDNPGRDGYVIFKRSSREEVLALKNYVVPSLKPPAASEKTYRQLPVSWIMDALEIQPNTASSRLPKKLGPSQDAGFSFVHLGAYSSQAVIRKTEGNNNGVIKLKDTNNSTEDFVFIKANPFGFAN